MTAVRAERSFGMPERLHLPLPEGISPAANILPLAVVHLPYESSQPVPSLGTSEKSQAKYTPEERRRRRQEQMRQLNAHQWGYHYDEKVQSLIGHTVDDSTRKKISEKAQERYECLEAHFKMSEAKGGTMALVAPLLLRGASVTDVVEIIPIKKELVENAVNRLRKLGEEKGGLRTPSKEESAEAKRRAHKKNYMLKVQGGYTEDQEKSITLAKKIFEAGFITNNLNTRKILEEIYKTGGAELPGSLAEQMRLEVLLQVLEDESEDKQILQTYVRLGEEVDAEWFRGSLVDETKFLVGAVTSTSGTESQETIYSESTRQEEYRIEGDNGKEIIEPLDVRVVEKLLRLLTEEEKTFIILLNQGLNYGQISETMGSSLSQLSDLETRIVVKLPNSEFGSWVKESCERSHEGISVNGAGEDSAPAYLSSGFYTEEVPHIEEKMNEQGESIVVLPVHEIEEVQEEMTLSARERRRRRLQRVRGMSSEVINGESTERFTFNGFVPVEERVDDHNLSPLSDGNGGQVPWEKILHEHTLYMTKVLWNVGIRDARDRQEVLQEAAVKVIAGIEGFKGGNMKGWVGTVTRNAALDRMRKNGKRKETSASDILGVGNEKGELITGNVIFDDLLSKYQHTPEDTAIETETVEEIIALLQRLPEERRDVVALRLFGELSYSEIAESTDLALGTVKSNLNRGITELRRLLAEQNKAA